MRCEGFALALPLGRIANRSALASGFWIDL